MAKASLQKTTLYEIAAYTDELQFGERLIFSSEDPDELEYYELEPVQYNVIMKTKLLYDQDYVILIGRINGHTTIAKSISILVDDIDNEDERIEAITEFLKEYYEKYMEKNKDGQVYFVVD
jgi:hypothetical protein